MPKITDLPILSDDEKDDACFRASDRAWSIVASLFDHRAEVEGLTYKELGDRIGRTKSQVQRWLYAPHNMTLKSFGLLVEGLDAEIDISANVRKEASTNQCHPSDEARVYVNISAFTNKSPTNAAYTGHYIISPTFNMTWHENA